MAVPCLPLLTRTRSTTPQAELSRVERLVHLKGAFALTGDLSSQKKYLTDKNIVIIDDVATTGTTLNEAAKVLIPVSYTHLTLPTNREV